jgi:hypothetical protein
VGRDFRVSGPTFLVQMPIAPVFFTRSGAAGAESRLAAQGAAEAGTQAQPFGDRLLLLGDAEPAAVADGTPQGVKNESRLFLRPDAHQR